MNDLGWFVEEDQFEDTTPFGLKQFTNVIATQTNSAKKRTLTLACHFDSKYFSNFKFIGWSLFGVQKSSTLKVIQFNSLRT